MIGRASALCLAIFASAITLAGCGNNVPSFLRTDDTPNYNIVGGEKLAVPANFVDSQSYGSMLVIASWPEMEGRPRDGAAYKHYAESNIRIHARPGGPRSLDISYRINLLEEDSKGRRWKTKPAGVAYGFDRSIIRFSDVDLAQNYGSRDIYVRRNSKGDFQAVMRCDGGPSPPGQSAQCELFEIFPELPGIEFAIGFDRDEALSQVNDIERAVRDKFLLFRRNGEKAFREDEKARAAFLSVEQKLAEIRAAPVTYAKSPPAAKWFSDRAKKPGDNDDRTAAIPATNR